MSRRHEQKHLLHNWSDCRYRDRPQNPRAVLRVRLAGAIARKRTIFLVDALRGDGKRFIVRAEEKLTAFLQLERVTHDDSN
jgi:hypothetical protein